MFGSGIIVLVTIIHHCKNISCYSPKSRIAGEVLSQSQSQSTVCFTDEIRNLRHSNFKVEDALHNGGFVALLTASSLAAPVLIYATSVTYMPSAISLWLLLKYMTM